MTLSPTQFEFHVETPSVTALTLGKQYRFQVIAFNAVGQLASNIVAATVADVPAMPAASPEIVMAETSPDQIRVAFEPFLEADTLATGGSSVLSY